MSRTQSTKQLRQDPVASRAADAWIRRHGAPYAGQWVALRGDEFLGASKSILELKRRMPPNDEDVLFVVIE